MKPPPIAALLAALVLAIAAPAAAGDRGGFLVGGSLGFNGTNACDNCEFAAGPSFTLYAGATLRPRLALLGEFAAHAASDGHEGAGIGFSGVIGAVQYWPIRWLWLGAGGGVGGGADDGDGPIAVAQAGIDFRSRSRFGIDLRGRYERRIDAGDGRRIVAVLVGFTWY